jgi:serine/threonine protein kinase
VTRPNDLLAGRYRVERRLGEGASGVVWLTRDTRERGLVWALKELDFTTLPEAERDEMVGLFRREADILMRLSHPGLPAVAEHFHEGNSEFLVMERVEGPTLDQILKTRGAPLDEDEVIGWALQVCSTLQYLHTLHPPIVYRDLKPSNLMLTVSGQIKLIDFGIARPMQPARPGDTEAYGTPGYCPPEQYMGLATPRSDLYALGATLYELLTRRDLTTTGFTFGSLRQYNAAISEELDLAVMRCLKLDPAERPASASEVEAMLRHVAGRPRHWWSELKRRWTGL